MERSRDINVKQRIHVLNTNIKDDIYILNLCDTF